MEYKQGLALLVWCDFLCYNFTYKSCTRFDLFCIAELLLIATHISFLLLDYVKLFEKGNVTILAEKSCRSNLKLSKQLKVR